MLESVVTLIVGFAARLIMPLGLLLLLGSWVNRSRRT